MNYTFPSCLIILKAFKNVMYLDRYVHICKCVSICYHGVDTLVNSAKCVIASYVYNYSYNMLYNIIIIAYNNYLYPSVWADQRKKYRVYGS